MPARRRPLITEHDVRRAARRGERTLPAADASVTPSARDAARALGVELLGVQPAAPAAASSGPAGAGHAPRTTFDEARPRVIVGADHGGVGMKDAILAALRAEGHDVEDVGTFSSDPVDYPDFARAVAEGVASGRAPVGIVVDGAGIGSCMVANKVPGVRAAMCHDVTTATNAREHNNANVLTLGGALLGHRLALEVVQVFLRTPFAGGRHAPRVAKIDALDGRRPSTS